MNTSGVTLFSLRDYTVYIYIKKELIINRGTPQI